MAHERVYVLTYRVAVRVEGDNPDSELIPSTREILDLRVATGRAILESVSLVNWKSVEREEMPQ
jgi:hypothetical protein